MRLTADSHPGALERYAHIRPARGPKSRICSTTMSGTGYRCTLTKGHRGPHVSHRGLLRRVAAVWDSGTGPSARSLERTSSVAKRPKRPIGLRERSSDGILATVWRTVVEIVSSPEDLALLVFLLAFVGFAVHWLTLIFLG